MIVSYTYYQYISAFVNLFLPDFKKWLKPPNTPKKTCKTFKVFFKPNTENYPKSTKIQKDTHNFYLVKQ